MTSPRRDHGGNIDAARARFGGDEWIDLSTGINRQPYPIPALPAHVWTDLPTASAQAALMAQARAAFGTSASGLAVPGAQAAIQMLPRLRGSGQARVISPTYNEHAACLRDAGWQVDELCDVQSLAGADLAVVVNPNNPDGRQYDPADLHALSRQVGRLIVDESFCETTPTLSLVAQADDRLIVLRSLGKFWGLAGLRLGFVFAGAEVTEALARMAGPWPVSGAALELGRIALADTGWRADTLARLQQEAAHLDGLARAIGWHLVGGTALFRTYHTPDALAAQERLARHRIWSRAFSYSAHWLRLGLPGNAAEWSRLSEALPDCAGAHPSAQRHADG
ncbi:MAG: threonine-phosphate decarboxylase [Rhodobacteraceae bacterium]|nr:threonine-phosphate decarboxylase [Paracoccaceae bacterium]